MEDTPNNTNFKSTVGTRIREVREKLGHKRPAFADLMGVTYGQQETYENDRASPNTDYWKKFEMVSSPEDMIYAIAGNRLRSDRTADAFRVPVLAHVPAGNFSLGFRDEDVIEYIWTMKTKERDVFGLKVRGESMSPIIHEGDYVLCSPTKPFINGKIYVVVTADSEHTVKYVRQEPGGYSLVPENPDYPSKHVLAQDVVKILRVVQVISIYE